MKRGVLVFLISFVLVFSLLGAGVVWSQGTDTPECKFSVLGVPTVWAETETSRCKKTNCIYSSYWKGSCYQATSLGHIEQINCETCELIDRGLKFYREGRKWSSVFINSRWELLTEKIEKQYPEYPLTDLEMFGLFNKLIDQRLNPPPPRTACGNGVLDKGEQCDPGIKDDPTACPIGCKDEEGRTIPGARCLQCKCDSDNDGLVDDKEKDLGTNLRKRDSDGDGYDDFNEYTQGADPNDPSSTPPEKLPEDCPPCVKKFSPGLFEEEDRCFVPGGENIWIERNCKTGKIKASYVKDKAGMWWLIRKGETKRTGPVSPDLIEFFKGQKEGTCPEWAKKISKAYEPEDEFFEAEAEKRKICLLKSGKKWLKLDCKTCKVLDEYKKGDLGAWGDQRGLHPPTDLSDYLDQIQKETGPSISLLGFSMGAALNGLDLMAAAVVDMETAGLAFTVPDLQAQLSELSIQTFNLPAFAAGLNNLVGAVGAHKGKAVGKDTDGNTIYKDDKGCYILKEIECKGTCSRLIERVPGVLLKDGTWGPDNWVPVYAFKEYKFGEHGESIPEQRCKSGCYCEIDLKAKPLEILEDPKQDYKTEIRNQPGTCKKKDPPEKERIPVPCPGTKADQQTDSIPDLGSVADKFCACECFAYLDDNGNFVKPEEGKEVKTDTWRDDHPSLPQSEEVKEVTQKECERVCIIDRAKALAKKKGIPVGEAAKSFGMECREIEEKVSIITESIPKASVEKPAAPRAPDTFACSQDSECGETGANVNTFVSGNTIYQTILSATCSRPATADAECSYDFEPKVKLTCKHGVDSEAMVCKAAPGQDPEPAPTACTIGGVEAAIDTCSGSYHCGTGGIPVFNAEQCGCPAGYESAEDGRACKIKTEKPTEPVPPPPDEPTPPTSEKCDPVGFNKCEGDNLMQCQEDGTWKTTACPQGCYPYTPPGPKCKDCTEGEERCKNNKWEKCGSHAWDLLGECPYGCDSAATKCKDKPADDTVPGTEKPVICSQPQSKCEGSDVMVCSPDGTKWEYHQTCADTHECKDGVCVKKSTCTDSVWDWGQLDYVDVTKEVGSRRCKLAEVATEADAIQGCKLKNGQAVWEPVKTCDICESCNEESFVCEARCPASKTCDRTGMITTYLPGTCFELRKKCPAEIDCVTELGIAWTCDEDGTVTGVANACYKTNYEVPSAF